MLYFLPKPIRGFFALLFYTLNTLFWFFPVMLLALLKLLPLRIWQTWVNHLLDGCAISWISVNGITTRLFTRINWQIQGLEKLDQSEWYMLLANHQSWADILVLQYVFNHRIPFIKFFLKKELLYVPFLGLAWWALDFPFMKRYSSTILKKNPHLKGKDIETTRKACEKFRHKPVTVMNFVEGTRLTKEKHLKQSSPYRHLLRPKAGGVAFVLGAMGDQLHKILDVTICYPEKTPNFWDYISGSVPTVVVDIQVLPIDEKLLGDYEDPKFRTFFQQWINELWEKKDSKLANFKSKS